MFTSRAPDASLADARRSGTRARVGGGSGGGSTAAARVGRPPCACPKTIAFLRRFHRDQSSLTGADAWEEHFHAEDDVLRPFLYHADWARIEREHEAFRRSGYSDLVLMAAHAAYEDRLVEEILARAAEDGVEVGRARVGDLMLTTRLSLPLPTTNKTLSGGAYDLDLRGRSKFEDPWMTQGRGSGGTPEGREYLIGLPMTGAARVDAMIEKVRGPAGDRVVPAEAELRALGDVMHQRIDADALKLRQATWRGWDYLVEKAGGSTNFFVLAAVEVGKWLTTQLDLGRYGSFAKAHALAAGAVETAIREMSVSIEAGVPYPWHAFEVTTMDLPRVRDAITRSKSSADDYVKGMSEVLDDVGTDAVALDLLGAAARSLEYNNQRWFGNQTRTDGPSDEGKIPKAAREVATAWWAMMLVNLSDPVVARTFRALNGDAWGALDLASDEQVLAVAAPVAAAYGVPARELAVELWDRSTGWSGEPAMLSQVGGVGLADVGGTPTNATQVQWWQLARNAIAIASARRDGRPSPSLPSYDPKTPSTSKPPDATSPDAPTGSSAGVGTVVAAVAALLGAFLVFK